MKRVALRVVLAALLLAGPAFGSPNEQADDHVRGMGSHVEATAGEHSEHGEGHVPHFSDINWFHGMVGEKDGVEPSLLWRPKGMPAPFGAMLLNTGVLFFLLVRYGRRPIAEALKKRKTTIMTGMDEAARMRREATEQLAHYEAKLAQIDADVERIQREMRESGQTERARILAEAKERHARMEREARLLVDQELKAAREALMANTVRSALRSAEERLGRQVTAADQQRLAEEYLTSVARAMGGGS
jgi:F-type H+-transporting ATPase subunit b